MNARLRDPDDALDRIQAELCDDFDRYYDAFYAIDGNAERADCVAADDFDVLKLPRDQQAAAALAAVYVRRDRIHAALWGEAERVLSQRQAQELRDKGEAQWNEREDAA